VAGLQSSNAISHNRSKIVKNKISVLENEVPYLEIICVIVVIDCVYQIGNLLNYHVILIVITVTHYFGHGA